MDFNFDKVLTTITFAGIIGLLILNASGTVKVVNALSSATTSYVGAVQGSGKASG